jgi:adenylate kinase family enzyme
LIDLRKIEGSPLQIRDDATKEALSEAMTQRHKMTAAIMDAATARISGKKITTEILDQLGKAAELLNAETDAMERILVEH